MNNDTPILVDGSQMTMAPGAERTQWGVIVDVTATNGVAYSNGRGYIARAIDIKYSIEVLINGQKVTFPAAAPNQPRPDYKVYSARKYEPCRVFPQGNRFAFQVLEAPYAEAC